MTRLFKYHYLFVIVLGVTSWNYPLQVNSSLLQTGGQTTQQQLTERFAEMGIAPPKSFAPDVMKVAETVLPPKPASSNGVESSGTKIKQTKVEGSANKKRASAVRSEGQCNCD